MSACRRYPTPAKTYYMDASAGSDSNLGTSTAWQTLAKINATTLAPGDRVVMTGAWSGTTSLTPSASGTPSRRISFIANGTTTIDRTTNYGIISNGKNYLVFDGIGGTAGNRTYSIADSYNILIQYGDCANTTADESSINLSSTTDGLTHHITIQYMNIHDTPGWGVTGGTNQVENVTIKYNTFTDIGATGGVQDHSIYFTNVSNFLIEGNTISNSEYGSIKLVESGGKITSGRIRRNKITGSGASASSGAGISLDGITHAVVIDNNHIADGNATGVCVGIGVVNNACSNIEVYNNTIVRHYVGINMDVSPSGWIVKNNNIVQDYAWIANSLRCCIYIADDATIANNTFDKNNLWFNDGASSRDPVKVGAGAVSIATWNGKTGVGTDLSVDPVFVTEYTDLHLQAGSTLINAAEVIAGVTVDKDGIVLDGTPDIGAYQYV